MDKFFKTVGGWFNADAGVGKGIVIGVGCLLALTIIIVMVKIIKNKIRQGEDDFDFSRLGARAYAEDNQDNVENDVDFVPLRTDEQFEAFKVQKVTGVAVSELKTKGTEQAQKEGKKPTKKLNGKWRVELKCKDEYVAELIASNGEVMLSSETYTTLEGAKVGISTIIKGVDNGKFVIYQDKNGNYYYKLKTANNRLLCVGEIYKSKDQCLKAVESVKRLAKDAKIMSEVFSGAQYDKYVPAPLVAEVKKGVRGKWKIESTSDGKYLAKLYANNGQLMLATEQVSLKKNAKNAIEMVKKNAEAGNFIIDKDKFGRYYYKLRNAQKSVICIGEAYDTLESCTNAIESVRRFALSATLADDNE